MSYNTKILLVLIAVDLFILVSYFLFLRSQAPLFPRSFPMMVSVFFSGIIWGFLLNNRPLRFVHVATMILALAISWFFTYRSKPAAPHDP